MKFYGQGWLSSARSFHMYCGRGDCMTNEQKEKIQEMRHNGISYTTIAEMIGIPRETIKSYCRRIGMYTPAKKPIKEGCCRNCGTPIVQNPKARKKVFCSADCRLAWWKANPQPTMNTEQYQYTCQHCGKLFTAYGTTPRKYCSHSCYISARFKGGTADA